MQVKTSLVSGRKIEDVYYELSILRKWRNDSKALGMPFCHPKRSTLVLTDEVFVVDGGAQEDILRVLLEAVQSDDSDRGRASSSPPASPYL